MNKKLWYIKNKFKVEMIKEINLHKLNSEKIY